MIDITSSLIVNPCRQNISYLFLLRPRKSLLSWLTKLNCFVLWGGLSYNYQRFALEATHALGYFPKPRHSVSLSLLLNFAHHPLQQNYTLPY